jgi:hypothetical protein
LLTFSQSVFFTDVSWWIAFSFRRSSHRDAIIVRDVELKRPSHRDAGIVGDVELKRLQSRQSSCRSLQPEDESPESVLPDANRCRRRSGGDDDDDGDVCSYGR